jgi:hypothetical protein
MEPRLGPPALAMCAMNLAGVMFYQPIGDGFPEWLGFLFFIAAYAVVAAVSFVVIWFFWRRHNWARWAVMTASVLSLANLLLLPSTHVPGQVVIVIEALFGAWLLYWLNTSRVARHFGARR